MLAQGKWKDSSLQLLWNSSAATFGAPLTQMRLYTNDWTPVSGWTDADVTILPSTEALASRPGAWQSAVVLSSGIVYRTTVATWPFAFSLSVEPTLAYGIVISQGVNTSPLYAARFVDGPYLLTNTSTLNVHPFIYLRNPDVALP